MKKSFDNNFDDPYLRCVQDGDEESEEVEDSDEDDEVEDEEIVEEEDTKANIKKMDSLSHASSTKIIKSTSYYRSMCREYTLNIFKYYSLNLITHAQTIGLDKLSPLECVILHLFCDFALRKNFSSKKLSETALKKLTNENMSAKTHDLPLLLKSLTCELCESTFKVEESLDLSTLKCELGHSMSRCQKSLLPLNSLYFRKCFMCQATWNYFDEADLPNFSQLIQNQSRCVFCD